MKQKLVSGLGILLVLPAFAGARLPAVNVAAGAVSARAQYGVPTPVQNVQNNKKRVVARATRQKNTNVSANVSPDVGEKIVANTEYLIPNKPSSDLWAKNDAPLRMPRASEFSVITSNDALPEEYIVPNNVNSEIAEISQKTSELDSQIARLMEMQRRADKSVAARRVVNDENVAHTAEIARAPDVPMDVIKPNVSDNTDDGVRVARVVVPRDELIGGDVVSRAVKKSNTSKIEDVREDMTKMSPSELRRAFRKTFLSENKHLSTYPIDDRFDVASDIGTFTEGFTSARDLSEDSEKIRPLEIKIGFRNSDSALSRENYNLLSEYAGIVVANPKRAIQVAIPSSVTKTTEGRKLAARRLAIVEQVLRDTGVSEQRIVPVLSERNEEGFVLRIISNEQFETLTRQKRNMFGDTVGSKTYKSMSW